MKEAFLRLEVEVVKLGDAKDIRDSASVIVEISAGGDTDVIHIDADGGPKWFMLDDDIAVDVVHHSLEGRWRVCKPEIHNCGFEKTVSGFKCRFLFIAFADAYIVVPPSDVKLCVYVCVAEVADEICDEREGVLISDCECVDLSVVLHGSQFTVLFLDEEK